MELLSLVALWPIFFLSVLDSPVVGPGYVISYFTTRTVHGHPYSFYSLWFDRLVQKRKDEGPGLVCYD